MTVTGYEDSDGYDNDWSVSAFGICVSYSSGTRLESSLVRSVLRHSLGGLVLLAGMAAPAAGHAQAGPSAVTPAQAGALGSQAYLYGFPLLETERVRKTATSVRCPDAKGDSPVNSFSHAERFTTPANRTIVAPNVDTLYSIAHLDLGRGPVVLSHPNMGGRYFVFQFLDPYTNTIGYVGTRTTGRRGRTVRHHLVGPARPEGAPGRASCDRSPGGSG